MRATMMLILLAATALGGCRSAYTAFGYFPGETCADRDSFEILEANYKNYKKAKAEQEQPEFLPVLVKIDGASEIDVDPGAPGGARRYCTGEAVFNDGTRQPVHFSWLRDWEPNLVSGPGFRWCMGEDLEKCRSAAPRDG